MRYLGNKTRLLDFIGDVLDDRGIDPGTAVDPFTGTASVAAMFRRRGFRVVAGDLMQYAHTFAHARIAVDDPPDLSGLDDEVGPDATLRDVVARLNAIEPAPGFLHEHFSPAGTEGERHERMYFTPRNAARIDAVRSTLERWRRDERIGEDAFHLLLTALIEAADRVANTAGVYAACIKSWQPNARKRLRLRAPHRVHGPAGRAERADARDLVEAVGSFDVLYIDPPYNTRQYPAYYHIPELIAEGWFDGPVELRGKTGLLPDAEKRSDWASLRRCEDALESLVAAADCRHVLLSYNAEGIIPEQTIERILKEHGRASTYRRYARDYRRYRSDSDGENRSYKTDEVKEFLYCVEKT